MLKWNRQAVSLLLASGMTAAPLLSLAGGLFPAAPVRYSVVSPADAVRAAVRLDTSRTALTRMNNTGRTRMEAENLLRAIQTGTADELAVFGENLGLEGESTPLFFSGERDNDALSSIRIGSGGAVNNGDAPLKIAILDDRVYVISEEEEWIAVDSAQGSGTQPDAAQSGGAAAAEAVRTVPSENEAEIYKFLKSTLGMNTAAACGVLANIYAESKFNPTVEVLDTNHLMSFGLFQWNGGRYTALKNYCAEHGCDYRTVSGQLQYLQYELRHSESGAFALVKSVENTREGAFMAAYYWASRFERCATRFYEGRAKRAWNVYWGRYSGVSEEEETGALAYLNLSGELNGKQTDALTGFATADIYINGSLSESGVTDYDKAWPAGVHYEIRNIQAKEGYTYLGLGEGSLRGSVGTNVRLRFSGSAPGTAVAVTLDASGGTVEPASLDAVSGTALGTLPLPVREGYVFDSWRMDNGEAASGETVLSGEMAAAGSLTLYARWVEADAPSGEHPDGEAEPAGNDAEAGNAVLLAEPSAETEAGETASADPPEADHSEEAARTNRPEAGETSSAGENAQTGKTAQAGEMTVSSGESVPVAPQAALSIENGTAFAGDTVRLSVFLRNHPGLAALETRVVYDGNTLSVPEVSGGTFLRLESMSSPDPDTCVLFWSGGAEAEDGLLCVLSFTVSENAAPGVYPVTISCEGVSTAVGSVTVTAPQTAEIPAEEGVSPVETPLPEEIPAAEAEENAMEVVPEAAADNAAETVPEVEADAEPDAMEVVPEETADYALETNADGGDE